MTSTRRCRGGSTDQPIAIGVAASLKPRKTVVFQSLTTRRQDPICLFIKNSLQLIVARSPTPDNSHHKTYDEKRDTPHKHFPIYPSKDYDMDFPNMQNSIGIMSTAPHELIKRVVAAAISYQARNSSIDYTYKRYLRDKRYNTNDGSRLDLRISRAIDLHGQLFSALLFHITTLKGKTLGNIVCEWTLMRVPHSINQLVALAHRGNLYECCAIGRMVLEQIAWAAKIDDVIMIHGTRAESSIGSLKKLVPCSGTLYGWLSSHTHWRHDGHMKAMGFEKEGLSTTLQSCRFKAISLTVALLLLSIATVTLSLLRRHEVSVLADKQRLPIGKKTGQPEHYLEKIFGPGTWSGAEIKKALRLVQLVSLSGRIRSVIGPDKDIMLLSQMSDGLADLAPKWRGR
jgi:hypothetical protein